MRLPILIIALLAAVASHAEVPAAYYSRLNGKTGAELKQAACDIIYPHTKVSSYSNLPSYFQTTDTYPRSMRWWDMYSNVVRYAPSFSGLNREHSMPKSWWKVGSDVEYTPAYVDLNHLYPADGPANQAKSNYPLGTVNMAGTVTFNNNVSIVGAPVSGQGGGAKYVYEPADEYKGDFARTYFYMVTCYQNLQWNTSYMWMLQRNTYPTLTSWAVDLLLAWHRQDPVSQKELDRNEAVYAKQHNRNPFIDYPDLVEHIWGTDKDVAWSTSGTPKEAIATPVNGSTVDLGITGIGIARSATVIVKGQNLTQAVGVSVSGAGFSASASTLAASAVNSADGATLTITFVSSAGEGSFTGSMTLTSGSATSKVTLAAETVEGLPVLPASNITENSFKAHWVSIDPAGTNYTLHVQNDGEEITGYPRSVSAASGSADVTGLVPATTYTYWVVSPSGVEGNHVSVTTAIPVPSIQFFFDGDLYFNALPGEPSEAAELMMDTENIDGAVTLSVTSPFQLSLDKTSWSGSLTMPDEAERFYVRLGAAEAGLYSCSLVASAGSYVNDDVTLEGIVAASAAFAETFEEPSSLSGYTGGIYDGSAAQWRLTGALIGSDTRDRHSGGQGLRTGKSSTAISTIEMTEPKSHGAGRVSFWAKAWSGEGGSVALAYSTDGGITWTTVKTFDISDDDWAEYSATLNVEGDVRLSLSRLTGGRIGIDDIAVTDYALSAVAELEYHSWDAFCLSGALRVESYGQEPMEFTVTSTNGALWHSSVLQPGASAELPLPAGVYLVTSRGFTRKTVVY